MDHLQTVLQELHRIPGPKKQANGSVTICCPFHNDRSPSCSLNLDPNRTHKGRKVPVGYFYCFSCSEGRGNWNKLAEKLGLKQFGLSDAPIKFHKRELSEQTVETAPTTIEDLLEYWELTDSIRPIKEDLEWRTFSGRFLNKFEALSARHGKYGTKYLVFPVTVGGDLVGAIKARWEKKKKVPSYINSKGHWTKDVGLFPYDYVKAMNPRAVWLVEGPRDALRLLRYGIPALCILGTQNWSDAKRDLVLALGVERVVLMMDGDDAGKKAVKLIRPTFEDHLDTIYVRMSRLAEKLGLDTLDPCEVPKKHLARFVRKYHLKSRHQ